MLHVVKAGCVWAFLAAPCPWTGVAAVPSEWLTTPCSPPIAWPPMAAAKAQVAAAKPRLPTTRADCMKWMCAHEGEFRNIMKVATAERRKFSTDTSENDLSCHTALPRLGHWFDREQ